MDGSAIRMNRRRGNVLTNMQAYGELLPSEVISCTTRILINTDLEMLLLLLYIYSVLHMKMQYEDLKFVFCI